MYKNSSKGLLTKPLSSIVSNRTAQIQINELLSSMSSYTLKELAEKIHESRTNPLLNYATRQLEHEFERRHYALKGL